jgi:hypothetical protein
MISLSSQRRTIEFLWLILMKKEVHDAIMQMEKNKAPGPDVFPAELSTVLGNN